MREPDIEEFDQRVLLLTPTARDAAASKGVLEANALSVHVCASLGELCREAERGAGALLLPEEALRSDRSGVVRSLLRDQPPWSDLPLIVLTPSGREHPQAIQAFEEFANVTLVKRPVELSVFVSTVRAALRDRRRQYEVRSHLAALRRSEEHLRALVTASSDAVYRMGPDWSELHQLVGREFIPDTDGPSRNWLSQYIDLEDRPRVLEAIKEAVRTKGVFAMEHRVRRIDGTLGWTFSRAVPILDEHGAIVEWFGTATDVTERKRAEEHLRRSEERYRALFNSIDEGFCIVEVLFDGAGEPNDYRFLEVNPAFKRQTGLNDAVGKRMNELSPGHEAHWFKTYGRVARTGKPVRFVNEAKELDGRWYDVYAFRIGEPAGCKIAILFTDITERKELERSLRHRVHELAEADRRKNEFLAMLAHELRNPLSAIHSAVKVSQTSNSTELLPQTLGIIERQAKNLARLIDDLLDVARITQGKVELRRESVDLISVINRAAQATRPLVEQKHHELTFETDFGPLRVDADPTRLEQIVGNLLTNAAKYTEPHGRIIVSARRDGAEAVIRVRDNGVGIAPDMLPKVFELFTQVDRSLARSEGGLGIGLSLVKRLVEMHGGTIAATSEPSRGSEFTVRLPLVEAALGGSEPERRSKVVGAGRRVLIVDDNADTAHLTGRLLQSMGFEVRLCHDGREAIESAREFSPKGVLLDIGLPGIDGYEVARQLRQVECCRDTLIIGASGYGDPLSRELAREAGFDHHLVKPVDIEAIAELVTRPR